MFSGIVEEYAEVVRIVKEQENLHLTLKCSFVDITFTVHKKDLEESKQILEEHKETLRFDHIETDESIGMQALGSIISAFLDGISKAFLSPQKIEFGLELVQSNKK